MKILIVSGVFYPEQTPRTYRTSELAIQLAKNGHEVKLIVPGGDYDLLEYARLHNIEVEGYKPVNYNNKYTPIDYVNRIITRVLKQFLAYPHITILKHLYPVLKNQSKDYDLLISIAAPHAIHWTIALLYKNKYCLAKKWIADCGDPFMLNAMENFKPPFYFKYIEKLWCKCCDNISVPTETSYKGYYPEFKSKIIVIPQAFNFEEIVLADYIPNSLPTFAYSGSFIINKRDPRPFLDYLIQNGYKFKAIFYTKQISLFEKYSNYGNMIEIRSYLPRPKLLLELSRMDFLLNLENGTYVQTPSKLIDYALTKRPILSVNSQDLNTVIIDEFMNGIYDNQMIINDLQKYNIQRVAKQFTEI